MLLQTIDIVVFNCKFDPLVIPNVVNEVIYYASGWQLVYMNIIDDLCGAVHQMRRLPLCATYSVRVENVDNSLANFFL